MIVDPFLKSCHDTFFRLVANSIASLEAESLQKSSTKPLRCNVETNVFRCAKFTTTNLHTSCYLKLYFNFNGTVIEQSTP